MRHERPGTRLNTYNVEWRHFYVVHVPVTLVSAALLVVMANEVIGCELSWPTLSLIWGVVVILPLAWKLPPAPSLESNE